MGYNFCWVAVLAEGWCSLLVQIYCHCRQERGRRGSGDSFDLARLDVVSLYLETL